jgi:hypothetical protein
MTSSTTPTLWSAPPSLAANSSNAAGAQFMTLFSDPAAWQVTASQSVGLVLSTSFILSATDAQLTEVFSFLNAHHLELMMNARMIPAQANGAGAGMEGYGSAAELSAAVQRISSLGGKLNAVSMDEPLVAGHEQTTGAQLSIPALAAQVATSAAVIKAVFPNMQ